LATRERDNKQYLGAWGGQPVTSLRPQTFRPEMKAALVGLLLLFTIGCGGYRFPGDTSSPATGTVSGRVLAIPCAPVEKPGTSCAGRPVPDLELDYVRSQVTARTFTDANGNYSIDLPPGTYAVKVKTYMRVISGPTDLTVSAGTSTVANYVLDSGIRVPGPAQPNS